MRALGWSFILFQFVWLNVVLPGHTRGCVALPGSHPVTGAADVIGDSCCPSGPALRTDGQPDRHDHGAPTDDARRRCALCYFAARVSSPPPVSFAHPPLGLCATLPPAPCALAFV